MQRVSEKKPLGTTLVTIFAGFGGAMNGFFLAIIVSFSPVIGVAPIYMFVGALNAVLGVVVIYVGISIWNLKFETRKIGMIVNVVLLVVNLFFFVIGIVGYVLCIGSLITLYLLDYESGWV